MRGTPADQTRVEEKLKQEIDLLEDALERIRRGEPLTPEQERRVFR